MPLLLALCLMATDGGAPGLELKIYRSREELPEQWSKQVPANFDFTTHQLATRARPHPPEAEKPRVCPPCRGIATREQFDFPPVRRIERLPLFRLARSPGRVFLVVRPASPKQAAELHGGPCPICTAP